MLTDITRRDMKNIFYIGAGSNTADGEYNVRTAIKRFEDRFGDIVYSDVYSTPSVSSGDKSTYFNAVVRVVATISAEDMAVWCKRVESEMGRTKEYGKYSVVIDLDVVVCNSEIIRQKDYDRSYFRIGFDKIESNVLTGSMDVVAD